MRARSILASLVLALSLACGDDDAPVEVDSGVDAGEVEIDAGEIEVDAGEIEVDAGEVEMDAGTDAGASDASTDAGPLLPPSDAGGDELFGDASTPDWVSIDVRTSGSCDALVPCGGDEVGTWDVSGGCVEVPVPEELMSCLGAAITRAEGRARGRVTFTGGTAVRAAQSQVEVEAFVPALCATFVGGCAGIQTKLRMASPDAVCVTEGAGDCRCAVRRSTVIDESGAYTVDGTAIVETPKRWDYCVAGDTLTYEDVSPTGPREIGIIELTRR